MGGGRGLGYDWEIEEVVPKKLSKGYTESLMKNTTIGIARMQDLITVVR